MRNQRTISVADKTEPFMLKSEKHARKVCFQQLILNILFEFIYVCKKRISYLFSDKRAVYLGCFKHDHLYMPVKAGTVEGKQYMYTQVNTVNSLPENDLTEYYLQFNNL